MSMINNEELLLLSEQVESCDPCEMISQILDWQKETKSNIIYSTLDTVIDIIIDNTVFR